MSRLTATSLFDDARTAPLARRPAICGSGRRTAQCDKPGTSER